MASSLVQQSSNSSSSGSRKRTREVLNSPNDDDDIPQIVVTVPKPRHSVEREEPASYSTASATSYEGVSGAAGHKGNGTEARVEQMYNLTICKPAPFSTDPEACLERDRCDYTKKITYQMARNGTTPNSRKIRVYADGIYDLFHQGHARQLMQAKNVFPNVYLIVGICSDELTHSRKGRTVMNDAERYEAVRHCRYVDEIISEAPWEISDEYLEKHKIDFVAHDEIPYVTEDTTDIYGPLKQRGMFVATERTDGVSTSDVVARIVKDYDVYVRRNLARGYSARDLNVGFLNEKKFKLQNKMDELRDKAKEVKGDLIVKWEEKSREFIENFLHMFGRDNLSTVWNKSKGRVLHLISPNGSENGDEEEDRDEDDMDDNDMDGHLRAVPPPSKRAYLEPSDREENRSPNTNGHMTNGHGGESYKKATPEKSNGTDARTSTTSAAVEV